MGDTFIWISLDSPSQEGPLNMNVMTNVAVTSGRITDFWLKTEGAPHKLVSALLG